MNFFDKALDSLDRDALWKLFRHYGVPDKIVNIIRNSYEGLTCRVVHQGQLSDSFEVKTGVRQGCLLSPFLFLLEVDWIMKNSTEGTRNGIQWTLWTQLEDLDFADDLALLSHQQQQTGRIDWHQRQRNWDRSVTRFSREFDKQSSLYVYGFVKLMKI